MPSPEQREYQRNYMREWRLRNPEKARANDRKNRERNAARQYQEARAKFNALKDGPCSDCDVRYPPYVMQWDHRDPSQKEFTIGQSTRVAWGRVLTEVAKCDLVCANCHAVRTHERRKERKIHG